MKSINNKKSPKKLLIILSLIVVIILLGYAVIAHKNSYWPYTAASSNSSDSTPKSPKQEGSEATGPTADKKNTKKGTTDTPVTNPPAGSVTPSKPNGTFVSNHMPNLSGSPAPNTENSTCTTTPGVDCVITFENGSITKSLPAQVTDANGNTMWNWSLSSIGLTDGEWTVTAEAVNGSQTASSTDPMKLVVKP